MIFNAGDGDGTKTGDFTAINKHIYTTSGDKGEYILGVSDVEVPDELYVVGNLKGSNWDVNNMVKLEKTDKEVMKGTVEFEPEGDNQHAYFTLVTKPGADWNEVNQAARYGAQFKDELVSHNQPKQMKVLHPNNDPGSSYSWKIEPGKYNIEADFRKNTITMQKNVLTGIENPESVDIDAEPVYFNLQGIRVAQPKDAGIYIVVRGNKVSKEMVR